MRMPQAQRARRGRRRSCDGRALVDSDADGRRRVFSTSVWVTPSSSWPCLRTQTRHGRRGTRPQFVARTADARAPSPGHGVDALQRRVPRLCASHAPRLDPRRPICAAPGRWTAVGRDVRAALALNLGVASCSGMRVCVCDERRRRAGGRAGECKMLARTSWMRPAASTATDDDECM